MKFYHLADLHFGKSIYGLSMLQDQQYWVEKFLSLCAAEKPDAVLIAGDVYDRSAPGADAVSLLDHFLTELAEMDIPVLMIAGNHDSGQRLSFGSTMLAKQNIHIAGTVRKELEHVTFADPDGFGPVTFWLMPYLFPEQVSQILEDDTIHSYESAVRRLLDLQDIDPLIRNVILSHQNVTAFGKEAERDGSESMIGGTGQVDYSAYDCFDYAALGHIHSSYPAGREEVRYAGTPLCYHFSETAQREKGPLEILLPEKGGKPSIRRIEIKPLHPMRLFTGAKEEIIESLKRNPPRESYVGITVTDERITPETSAYLRDFLSANGSVLLELVSSYRPFENAGVSENLQAADEKPLEDLFSDFYTEQNAGIPPADDEYSLMQYVGETVRNRDPYLPADPKEAERIIEFARKTGRKAL